MTTGNRTAVMPPERIQEIAEILLKVGVDLGYKDERDWLAALVVISDRMAKVSGVAIKFVQELDEKEEIQ